MRNKGKLVAFAAAVVIIIAGAVWYFASPGWTLHEMKAAADANDADALSSHIDYPALRESLKAEIMVQMIARAQSDKSGFGGFGLAVGSAMLGPMVDGILSPAGVRALFVAKRNSQPGAPTSARAPGPLQVPDHAIIERRSFSEFHVTTKENPQTGLVFKLHGFSWKLSGMELPADAAK